MDILSTDKDHYYLKQYSYKISQTFINSLTFIIFSPPMSHFFFKGTELLLPTSSFLFQESLILHFSSCRTN